MDVLYPPSDLPIISFFVFFGDFSSSICCVFFSLLPRPILLVLGEVFAIVVREFFALPYSSILRHEVSSAPIFQSLHVLPTRILHG